MVTNVTGFQIGDTYSLAEGGPIRQRQVTGGGGQNDRDQDTGGGANAEAIAALTTEVADHESRIDALETTALGAALIYTLVQSTVTLAIPAGRALLTVVPFDVEGILDIEGMVVGVE